MKARQDRGRQNRAEGCVQRQLRAGAGGDVRTERECVDEI